MPVPLLCVNHHDQSNTKYFCFSNINVYKKEAIKTNLRKHQTVTEVCYAFMVAAFVAAGTASILWSLLLLLLGLLPFCCFWDCCHFVVAAFVTAVTAAILLLLGLLPFCGRCFCCCWDCCHFVASGAAAIL